MNNSASRQYGACFGGVLYDHGIDPDYQMDFWVPYSPCKNGLDDGDRAPANFLTRHHPINVQDDRKALFIGMVLLERIAETEKGLANNRYRDKGWNVQQKPLSDVASFEILTRRQLAFPVFVPSQKDTQGTRRQQLHIHPVALISSPNTTGANELRTMRREDVFFFSTYREPGDTEQSPNARCVSSYTLIRAELIKGPPSTPATAITTRTSSANDQRTSRAIQLDRTGSEGNDANQSDWTDDPPNAQQSTTRSSQRNNHVIGSPDHEPDTAERFAEVIDAIENLTREAKQTSDETSSSACADATTLATLDDCIRGVTRTGKPALMTGQPLQPHVEDLLRVLWAADVTVRFSVSSGTAAKGNYAFYSAIKGAIGRLEDT